MEIKPIPKLLVVKTQQPKSCRFLSLAFAVRVQYLMSESQPEGYGRSQGP